MLKEVLRMATSIASGNHNVTNLTSSRLRPEVALALRRRRQRKRQKPLLFFLTIVILLSFYLTVGQIEDVCVGPHESTGDEYSCQFNSEGGNDATIERDSLRTGGATTTKVKIIDPTHDLPQLLTSPRLNHIQNRIWIVFAHRETCEFSQELLMKLTNHVIPSIEFKNEKLDNSSYLHPLEMIFVPMPIGESEVGAHWKAEILKRMGITRLPSLFFLWDEDQEPKDTAPLVEMIDAAEVYRGRSESITDLVNGLSHYLSRLQVRLSSRMNRQEHREIRSRLSPLAAIRVESLTELRNIIRNAGEMKILQIPPLPLDPDNEADHQRIRYLMDDDTGETRSDSGDNDHNRHEDGADFQEGRFPQIQSMSSDPYHVIIQCRNYLGEKVIDEIPNGVEAANLQVRRSSLGDSISQLYQEYDQAVKVLGTRRDTLFSILEPGLEDSTSNNVSPFCDSLSDDGLIRVWGFPSNQSLAKVDLDDGYDRGSLHDYFNNSVGLIDELSSWLLPELLWFDRRMTAPIAFHPRNRRHAILFVDFHDRTSASKTRSAIRLFREECRRLRTEQDVDGEESNFVCLVVPSTEIRVLNTFGIDIWSHLDHEATEKMKKTLCKSRTLEKSSALDDNICDGYEGDHRTKGSESGSSDNNLSKFSSILPTMLITDRRKDGAIHRYYLDPPITSRSISEFFDDFIRGRIEPEIKSSHVNRNSDFVRDGEYYFPTNKHFVHLLTADSLEDFLKANQEKHVLVELYAPTCGHCKRFNTIWNSLGSLIEFLGWSDKLLLARNDVTSNEIIVPGMAATWLPDLFYFGVGVSENPIHYENTPSADDIELGSINDPIELLEWWMTQAGDVIDEAELLHDLENTIATFS